MYICIMVTGALQNSLGKSGDDSAKTYWLDVYVKFHEITRQERIVPNARAFGPSSAKRCVLLGAGTVGNGLAVVEKGENFDRFAVNVTTFNDRRDTDPISEGHRSAKMVWSEFDPRSPQLEVYIPNNMLRHLVELYVTKRIDIVMMSMKIAVIEWPVAEVDQINEVLPLLYKDGHLYFRRAECELLSVRASISREYAGL
jgi:hypothetical protein